MSTDAEIHLPARATCLQQIYQIANDVVDDIGVRTASEALGISTDTMRRRLRGDLAWSFEELIDLARYEQERHQRRTVAKSITRCIAQKPHIEPLPQQLTSNLPPLLLRACRFTTEIAAFPHDGPIAIAVADRLLKLPHQTDSHHS